MTDNGPVSYGDETIYGESTMRDEPLFMSISNPETLVNNNLVSKSYTDYRVLRPANEPLVSTPLHPNQLTNNHLVSKKYVDEKITTSVTDGVNDSLSAFPTIFSMGKAYNPNDAFNTLDIVNGLVYVKFKNLNQRVFTCCFDIDYYITRSPPNSHASTWYGNAKGSIFFTAKYLVNYHLANNGTWSGVSFYLLNGSILHQNWTFEGNGQTYKMVNFGLSNGLPSITIGFPDQFQNVISTEGWVSSFGTTIRLVTATPNNVFNQNLSASNPNIAYFSNTI
jgi:hypothetical protein